MIAAPVPSGAARGSSASSAPSSSASARRLLDRIDGDHATGARHAGELDDQQPDRSEPDHGDVVADLDLRVVGGDERDRPEAGEERPRRRLGGALAEGDERVRGLGIEVHDGLLPVRRARVHDGAGSELGDRVADLLDPADELVAEMSRVRRALRLGPHEHAQVAVERAVGVRGAAAVEVELGAVADAADQRAHADVARPEVRQVLVLQPQGTGSFEHERPSHFRLLLLRSLRGASVDHLPVARKQKIATRCVAHHTSA